MGEGLQINVQYLYPFRVVVEEDLQIYVQYLYPIWKGRGASLYVLAFFVGLWLERPMVNIVS